LQIREICRAARRRVFQPKQASKYPENRHFFEILPGQNCLCPWRGGRLRRQSSQIPGRPWPRRKTGANRRNQL